MTVLCVMLGHRYRFWADGATMHWACGRDCGEQGCKTYPSVQVAERYARAFDRERTEALSRRPTLSLLPLWLINHVRTRPSPMRSRRRPERTSAGS